MVANHLHRSRMILPRLIVGDRSLCTTTEPNTAIVCSSKTCHKRLVGYSGWGAPRGPEYFTAKRTHRIALNIVDSDNPEFMPPREIFDETLPWMREHYDAGRTLVVHCDEGRSRAPTVALLFMASINALYPERAPDFLLSPFIAMDYLRRLYPEFAPAPNMKAFIELHLGEYIAN